jgi:LCP family protein required for cell wall assembly
LWPGLGQAYNGRRRAAVLYAVPLLAVAVYLIATAARGLEQLLGLLLSPSSAITIAILLLLTGLWRLLSMADAGAGAIKGPWFRGRAAGVFLGLALPVVVIHGYAGYVAWAFYQAGTEIYVGDDGPDGTIAPAPSLAPGVTSAPSDDYDATPFATPETEITRINILLTGVDSAAQRTNELTDTMLVVSVDPESGDMAMVSFPRDISSFPMYNGQTYRGKINSLMTWARQHPQDYPDGPLPTLAKQLGFLLGVPIHYYAAVDLAGFRKLIDAAGGVTVDNARAINDPRYDWLDGSIPGFRLSKGIHTLNGRNALAYVRSRQGAGDNDFTRARRQQQVLLALRQQLTTPAMLPKLPELINLAGETLKTNFPSERVDEMLGLAAGMGDADVEQVVLGPPYAFHPPNSETGGVYTLRLKMDELAALSVELFGEASSYWTATASPAPVP